ncbi:hypothetical protein BV210_16045 [Halorientalis sp. IM1011]|uniref:DUF7537 family lipoprotein n=1 Tax=Halorientalis sp. IM1011 TaxID=1932360 RepID=UPI00097CD010|nr:hypothetical protein [Halorientalis sp. IM1011]AQL44125.1 hypothetical protein BV210_16045 [Halorientalis sp. IM1011]
MNRNRVVLIALVAAVALAGCGGLGGDSGTPTETPANGSNATTDWPDTTTATDGPYDLPLNGSEIRDRHRTVLDDGTFSYRQNAVVRAAGSGAVREYTNLSAQVDRTTGEYRYFQNVTRTNPTAAYVDANGTAYLRERGDGQIAYDRQTGASGSTDAYLYPEINRYLRGLSYEYEGTERANGETVHVYAANGTDGLDPDAHGLTALDSASLTELSAELRVAEDGSIRTFRYDVTGTNPQGSRVRYVVAVEYAGVGSTAVSEPSWLDEAKNVTGE